jgi:3-oxoadipate enol-lactonase
MTDIRVDRGGWSLAAVESGQGAGAPVVVMSNSLGATRAMWDHQARWLGERARVIRYDTRGHGASDTPAGPYSFDDLVEDALAVMDAFDVGRAAYVGLSLGGMTGLGLGLRAPERLTRLAVSAARADAPAPFVQSWDDRVAKIEADGLAAIWPGTLERWLTPAFQQAEPETVAALKAQFLETTVAGYAGCAAALKGLDYLRHLGNLTIPTLYIAGADDMGAPASAMEGMAAATPDARYVCVGDAAHIVNHDGRADFDAALRDFLEF